MVCIPFWETRCPASQGCWWRRQIPYSPAMWWPLAILIGLYVQRW
jgi:hypothetical protein